MSSNQQFEQLRACVMIPTYNNHQTLAAVIESVSLYTQHIIVVNDGSTDNTEEIVAAFPMVQLVSYPVNVGKGWALRTGFAYALSKGYQYAITIDSDGQHFAKDLPTFIQQLETERNAIIIGARNMEQDSVPGGSSFGNKFSNFWFKVETGITSPDTQSGYRLYPLLPLQNMHFFTKKYEFEIEVLVRAAWAGVQVLAVPVTVYYPPAAERISHFRPFKDFFRISVLNTVLVLMAFLYIKPRDLLRSIFIEKKTKQILRNHLFAPHQSIALKSVSVGFGVFMGIVPIWGFQLAVAILLAIPLKLNKALVILAANISIPPMIPFIIFGSYKAGAMWMGEKATTLNFTSALSLDAVATNLRQYIYGSITLAIVVGLIIGGITFIVLQLFTKKHAPPQ